MKNEKNNDDHLRQLLAEAVDPDVSEGMAKRITVAVIASETGQDVRGDAPADMHQDSRNRGLKIASACAVFAVALSAIGLTVGAPSTDGQLAGADKAVAPVVQMPGSPDDATAMPEMAPASAPEAASENGGQAGNPNSERSPDSAVRFAENAVPEFDPATSTVVDEAAIERYIAQFEASQSAIAHSELEGREQGETYGPIDERQRRLPNGELSSEPMVGFGVAGSPVSRVPE